MPLPLPRHQMGTMFYSRRAALWARLYPLFLFIVGILAAVWSLRSFAIFLFEGRDAYLWWAVGNALLAVTCLLIFNPNRNPKGY